MVDLDALLAKALDPVGRQAFDDLRETVATDPTVLAERFPGLPRRLGRQRLPAGRECLDQALVDLGAWRRCDLGAALLLTLDGLPADPLLRELFLAGDMEERTMVLRTLSLLPVTDATIDLLGEVQRTNTVPHVEAGACDSDLLARAVEAGALPAEDFNKMVLKVAFIDLPLARLFRVLEHGNRELSRMLQDLATEREAAGRSVWVDTDRLTARAPTLGTVARLLGGLEHGDDGRRLAAAEGLLHLNRDDLRPFAAERLSREPRPEVRAVLEQIIQ